jgi:hypothetical protein
MIRRLGVNVVQVAGRSLGPSHAIAPDHVAARDFDWQVASVADSLRMLGWPLYSTFFTADADSPPSPIDPGSTPPPSAVG